MTGAPRIAALIAITGFMTMAPAIARAALIFYNNQSSFNTAEPGLSVQDFSSADLYGQTYVTQPNGIDNSTNDAVFAAGSILPGLTISTLAPGSQSTALAVYAD